MENEWAERVEREGIWGGVEGMSVLRTGWDNRFSSL